jgi:hypothetical protein
MRQRGGRLELPAPGDPSADVRPGSRGGPAQDRSAAPAGAPGGRLMLGPEPPGCAELRLLPAQDAQAVVLVEVL